MNQEYAVQFDRHWSDFQSKLKSRIQMRSQSGALSCPQMNVILKDCALGWDSRGTMWGWWMADLEAQNPDKARIVREILLEDMCFRKIPPDLRFPVCWRRLCRFSCCAQQCRRRCCCLP